MSKDKIEKDYQAFSAEIEQIAQEDIRKIREKLDDVERDAETTGEGIQRSLENAKPEARKKVNTQVCALSLLEFWL